MAIEYASRKRGVAPVNYAQSKRICRDREIEIKRENMQTMQRALTLVNTQLNKHGPHVLYEDEIMEIVEVLLEVDNEIEVKEPKLARQTHRENDNGTVNNENAGEIIASTSVANPSGLSQGKESGKSDVLSSALTKGDFSQQVEKYNGITEFPAKQLPSVSTINDTAQKDDNNDICGLPSVALPSTSAISDSTQQKDNINDIVGFPSAALPITSAIGDSAEQKDNNNIIGLASGSTPSTSNYSVQQKENNNELNDIGLLNAQTKKKCGTS